MSIALGVLMLLAIVSVQAGPPREASALDSQAAALGTSFTYQGKLAQSGTPVTGTCDFQFGLYDAATTGTQVGITQSLGSVGVADGVFTVQLDFGDGAFQGDGRWLQIAVRCPAGSGSYTTLAPRQALTPAPYALALPGLWTQQNATSPNLIGGYSGNTIGPGIHGVAIGGGGTTGGINQATESFATIGGGATNAVHGPYAIIGGGYGNTASSNYATIGGGSGNAASAWATAVGGGWANTASGADATVAGGADNTASSTYATVSGGRLNTAGGQASTVGGGYENHADAFTTTIGGGEYVYVTGQGTTVAGGSHISATGDYAAVGGGEHNTASGDWSVVGGGEGNTASISYATIGGGQDNTADFFATVGGGKSNRAIGWYATIGGGVNNTVGEFAGFATVGGGLGNEAYGDESTIGGGELNAANGDESTIGGGYGNIANGNESTIGGGFDNITVGDYAAVGGGRSNLAIGWYATVAGGSHITVTGNYAAVGGGRYNTVEVPYGTIAGGGYTSPAYGNRVTDEGGAVGGGGDNQAGDGEGTATDAYYATVGGGWGNTASNSYATIPGGDSNTAAGDYSFAAGRRAQANNTGCFVWGDSTNDDVACNNNDRTIFRSTGGFYIYTNNAATPSGLHLASGGSSWNSHSDRNVKENFQPVDTQQLLARLAQMPVTTWNYKSQDPAIRHVGPMAQDFNALLPGLGGEGETYINTLDADGVTLAAVQGLYQMVQEKDGQIAAQQEQIDVLRRQNEDLAARVTALEQTAGPGQASGFSINWLLVGGLLVVGVVLAQRRRTRGKL